MGVEKKKVAVSVRSFLSHIGEQVVSKKDEVTSSGNFSIPYVSTQISVTVLFCFFTYLKKYLFLKKPLKRQRIVD